MEPTILYGSPASRDCRELLVSQVVIVSRQARDLQNRPDLDGALARPWNPCGNADRLVQVLGIDQKVAAQLFTGLREWTIGHKALAVAHPDAGGRRHELERVGGQILTAYLELMGQLRRLLVAMLSLGFTPGLLVRVNQQHVLHVYPPSGSRTASARIDSSTRKILESKMPADILPQACKPGFTRPPRKSGACPTLHAKACLLTCLRLSRSSRS